MANPKYTEKVTIKKLTYVQGILQKNFIMETLEQNGIVVISKPVGISSVFGYSMLQEELYVKEADYNKASKLLQDLEIQEIDYDELERMAASYAIEDEEPNNNLNDREPKKYGIKLIFLFGIILIIGMLYKNVDPVIKWHDETLKWVVAQELKKHTKDDIRVSDVSKIKELYLDAYDIKDIKDLKYFYNLKVLALTTPQVDDLSPIKNLTHLDKLLLCGLDIKTLDSLNKLHLSELTLQGLPLQSIDSLGQMEKLQNLTMKEIPISSIEAIAGAKSLGILKLENMDLDNLGVLKELPNLSSLSIKGVKIPQAISLNELGRYQSVSLSGLKVEGQIDSQHMTTLSLENIDLGGSTDWLHAEGLKHLTLSYCGIKDFSALHDVTKLESLNVAGNRIRNIQGLKDFTNLESLSLADNPINDLSPIQGLKNLEILDLSGIDFKGKEDCISGIRLKELKLSNCKIANIRFLENQKDLNRLDLSRNQIKDIGPLQIYGNGLKYLDISKNPVRDLTPLSQWYVSNPDNVEEGAVLNISGINLGDMAKEQWYNVLKSLNLKELYAKNCGLTDVEFIRPYRNLQYLDISYNKIKYVEPILCVPKLREVNAKGDYITEEYISFGIEANWMTDYAVQLSPGVYGCPMDWKQHYLTDSANTWFRITLDRQYDYILAPE